jgi:hypothetical protein
MSRNKILPWHSPHFLHLALIPLACLAIATTATAQNVCWRGTSTVLPQDSIIPQQHRFEAAHETSQPSIVGNLMHVSDTAEEEWVLLGKDLAPLSSSSQWECTFEVQMHSALRTWGVPMGNATHVHDDTYAYMLGVDDDGVGFFPYVSNTWVSFVAMDVSDALHEFRIVASTTQIELFIDGAATPAISLPKTAFPSTVGPNRLSMVATSAVAVAEFDMGSYDFRRVNHGLALESCPSVASAGDPLQLKVVDAQVGSLTLLYVSSINGAPFLQRVALGTVGADCSWSLAAAVPAGLTGIEVGFLAFGFEKSGLLNVTNEASIAFD